MCVKKRHAFKVQTSRKQGMGGTCLYSGNNGWIDQTFKVIFSYIVRWRPAWAILDPVVKGIKS